MVRDEVTMRKSIKADIKRMCHYSQMQVFATSTYQKKYFQRQIEEEMENLINRIESYYIEDENRDVTFKL